jgi:purine-binding chemotaxis protein CheW
MSLSQENSSTGESESRFLIFGLADLLFAVPLLQIRELVEYQVPKPLPNTHPYCIGAINLRGEIVGIIDLRIRFALPTAPLHRAALMVCESDHGSVAALVERVVCVAPIDAAQIEKNTNVTPKEAPAYVLGVARRGDDLVNIIDLQRLLESDEWIPTAVPNFSSAA